MKRKSVMKKLLCVILAVAVFAVSVPFTVLAADTDDVNFVVLSDLHYFAASAMGNSAEDRKEFNDMMLMNNATSGIAPELTDTALKNVEEMAKNGDIDFVLIPGDLTKNAEYAAHVELTAKLKAFEENTGIPVYVINGNHDINNQRAAYYDGENLISAKKAPELRDTLDTTPQEFEALYKDFGYSSEGGYYSRYKTFAENSEGSLSYAIDLPNDYRLIAIDSQLYSADNTDEGLDEQETAGKVSEKLLAWTVSECEKAKADGKTIIGLTHTNTVPHFETEVDLFDNFVFRDWEKAADALADAGMHYTISGHVHMQDVATYVSDNGEEITDITGASILNYPNMFRSVQMSAASDGNITCTYETHDIDKYFPVVLDGVEQPKPFRNISWAYNFGGSNIKTFAMNVLEYQLRYGFGKDIKDAGGLYNFVEDAIDVDTLIGDLADSDIVGDLSAGAIRLLLVALFNQVEYRYLSDPAKTLKILEPMIDKLLNIEVSDYPSTAFKDTLGFGSKGEKGTLGDLASTVLAYHYTNNEDPKNDKFLMNALERFNNNQNAEVILDTLLTVVLDDLLQGEILKNIKIDPISWGINGPLGPMVESAHNFISGIVGAGEWTGLGAGDIISVLLLSGIVGGDTLSGMVYSALDEYLTPSQYEVIDGEFYRILKDLTHDENPGYMADFDGAVNYNGKVAVPLSQDNLRLPSHIAVTFGEDSATSVNISYVTKYSLDDTVVQIVPYSENPDFSNSRTIDADCEIDAQREYSAIDLSFIGIIKHKMSVNRHTVQITGLEPGKQYCYRVGDADRGWWSDTGVISTADNGTAFSFLHITDPQGVTENQYKNNWAMALDTAFDNHDIDFLLGTGDMVDNGNDFVEWKRMFNTASDSLMNTVLMTGTGNHEERGENANIQNFVYSNLPEQDTTTGVYYSFDYNTAHIAVLNTNDLSDSQALSDKQIQWLKADMSASKAPWKFIALHKAIYSNGSHFDDEDIVAIRAQLLPLMNELDIDLVFQGHDHVYMRTDVLKDNAVVKTETGTLKYNGLEYTTKIKPDGTIYSINGTIGPKHYEPKASSETSGLIPDGEKVLYLEVPSYSHIQIDGGNLYFDTYSVENNKETRVDQFAISKVITLENGTELDGTNNIIPNEPSTDNNNGGNNNGNNNGNNTGTNNIIGGLGNIPGKDDAVLDNIIDSIVNGSAQTRSIILISTFTVTSLLAAYFVVTNSVIKRRKEDL